MIIKRIEREEIKNIDNKKEIIIKVDDTVQNYKIFDTYTYINKQGKEVFINERCLVDEDGYYYRVSRLWMYEGLEFFIKYEEGFSKTKIMKYFYFAIIADKKYIVIRCKNKGLESTVIINNNDDIQNHLDYWSSENNSSIVLDMFLMDYIEQLSSFPYYKNN